MISVHELRKLMESQLEEDKQALNESINELFVEFTSDGKVKEATIKLYAENLKAKSDMLLKQRDLLLGENEIKH